MTEKRFQKNNLIEIMIILEIIIIIYNYYDFSQFECLLS